MPESKKDFIIVDDKFAPETALDVLYKYKAELIESLRKILIEKDKDQPGKLIQSINVKVQEKGAILSFELAMEDYWKYVDEGRRPGAKQPPQKAILDFIKVRGISVRPKKIKSGPKKRIDKAAKKISKEKALKQIAFVIGRSIKKKGIKPTHFYTQVVNDSLKERLTADLTAALKKDIEVNIIEALT